MNEEKIKVIQVTLKNPSTTTSSFSMRALAASTVSIVVAGGPVFFFSQLTKSAACLPPTRFKLII